MSHHRHAVTAAGAPEPAGPYSHAVVSGGLVFCAGQTPIDPATGELVGGSVADETRQCLRNLALVAEAAGASLADAVRCGVFVTDLGTFGEVNAAYGEFFGEDPPARTTVEVSALPRGCRVEIDAIVALPD